MSSHVEKSIAGWYELAELWDLYWGLPGDFFYDSNGGNIVFAFSCKTAHRFTKEFLLAELKEDSSISISVLGMMKTQMEIEVEVSSGVPGRHVLKAVGHRPENGNLNASRGIHHYMGCI